MPVAGFVCEKSLATLSSRESEVFRPGFTGDSKFLPNLEKQ